ncbi:MAG: response regulator [Hyphomicrobiaceae bacterium]
MKQCLVVDDSPIIRKVAKCLLTSMGYGVEEAEDGQQALEMCQKQAPDIILLDRDMPVMGAQEFLNVLARTHRGAKPFVLFATTDFDPADISRCIDAGADDYILKPFDRTSLGEKLQGCREATS